MRHRVVSDVASIQANCLAIEEIGKGFVGRRRIAKRTGRQGNSAEEVFVQLAFNAKANTDAAAITVRKPWEVLEEAFAAYANVTRESEFAH